MSIQPFARAALAAILFAGCAGSLTLKKPEQGLQGTFTTYGPPAVLADCSPLKTQFQKDSCRHENERVIEEPLRSDIRIRNVETREARELALDAQGSYRSLLDPGTYVVCVHGECSDPIEVRMGGFSTYGQRLPRPADPAAAKSPARR